MDHSGRNRYELLFMDDDAGEPMPLAAPPQKKKQTNAGATTNSGNKKTSAAANKKNSTNSEKENKSGALNKNESGKKGSSSTTTSVDKIKQNSVAPAGNNNGNPKVNTNTNNKSNSNVNSNTNQNNNANTSNKNRTNLDGNEDNKKVNVSADNGEVREKRNNRRNFRENNNYNEYGNEQREQRQFKDRDNRDNRPPRNREGGYRKREFDRQSGSDKTGVKAIDKRDGSGAHNWGSVKQEIEDITKSTADPDVALTDKEESSNEQTPEQPPPPEETETKEMTLDEWKALRGVRIKPQYNIRKPNEGEDTTKWKKMIVLNKKKSNENSEEELEYDPSMYPQRVGRLQRIVDIQFNFNDGRRGGGGFGRNRGRGPRPNGSDRPFRGGFDRSESGAGGRPRKQTDRFLKRGQTNNILKVDDERQFPTLS